VSGENPQNVTDKWSSKQMDDEKEAINAVVDHAIDRHSKLSRSNVIGFDKEDLQRVKTDEHGHLVFSIENVAVREKEEDDGVTIWYIAATIYFDVEIGAEIEGSTDIYQCYRCGEEWCVEWYAE